MKMRAVLLALLALVACCAAVETIVWKGSDVEVHRLQDGRVHLLRGMLGTLSEQHCANDGCTGILREVSSLIGSSGDEHFELVRVEDDPAGNLHYRVQQYISSVEVDGGEAIVHVRPETHEVYAVSCNIATQTPQHEKVVQMGAAAVQEQAAAFARRHYNEAVLKSGARAVFLYLEGELSFVVRARVHYRAADGSHRIADAYLHPGNGDLVFSGELSCDALDRTVYTANYTTALPGDLVMSEGDPQNEDRAVDGAYNNAGFCYNFYWDKFRRDSYDGKGAPLIATVHYMKNYNNAFWNGEQMVYGDGDGVLLANFSQSLQVVCHELTHAVVQETANLRYWKESGALNEGWADAMGNAAVIYRDGGLRDHIWEVGRGVVLTGNGRIMNNPTLDGRSSDYYPTRYMGLADNGGVHGNSGIANLAFALLTTGGAHPQQKTKTWVNGLGIYKAEQVWYYGLKNYMMRETNFLGARAATVMSASDLFSDDDVNVVECAWAAVGVGDAPAKPYPTM